MIFDLPSRGVCLEGFPLGNLYGNAHGSEEPPVVRIPSHPARLQVEDFFDQTLHWFDGCGSFLVVFLIGLGEHLLDHLLTRLRFVHSLSRLCHQLDAMILFQTEIELLIIGFAVHKDLVDHVFKFDDLYPAYCQRNGTPRRAGIEPALSDAECLTIEIVGQFLGHHSQKQLYEQMRERFGSWFPAFPLPICKLARRHQRRIFRTDAIFEFPAPTKGYCAAKKEDYFGFKGGLRITDYGLIVQAPILQAYGHDSRSREALLGGVAPGTRILCDSAFMDLEWQKLCLETYDLCVQTPIKSNMKPDPDRMPFKLRSAGKVLRRLIETVYAQLTERFQVARMKVRDAWHLQNLWNTKILTHTICVFFNITLRRDPLDFDGLVRF